MRCVHTDTDRIGIQYGTERPIGSNTAQNFFYTYIESDGSPIIVFSSTAARSAWLSALGLDTLAASVAALADTTATLAAANDADADAICALYVDLIHHDIRDIDSVPEAYRAQVSQQLALDGDDWSDPYVDDDSGRAQAPDTPLPLE